MKKLLVLLLLALLPLFAQAQNIVYSIPINKEIFVETHECEGAVLLMDNGDVMIILQYAPDWVTRRTFHLQSYHIYSNAITISGSTDNLGDHVLTIDEDGTIHYEFFDYEEELFDEDFYLDGNPAQILPVCKKIVADARTVSGPFFSLFE
ncbi:MAG: hypothetical protein J5667_01700 [Bacteroidales bacterium]|nr:hypothetical protein [Bacteroidales bacterium]